MYGDKRNKSIAAKEQANTEGLSVREVEHHMVVEMFLEGQARWEVDSSHHPIILHEMIQHAMEQGQKKVEHMICQGCQHGLLKLDPKADISAIQLVGPQTSREELKSLYYEVYKLQRLPGSPPGEPEWIEELTAEVVFSLEDHLQWKGGEPPWMMEEPGPIDIWSPRSKTPRRGRRDTSVERGLAEVMEAHQRALATAATLEEEIEKLSQSITRGWLEACAHSGRQDPCRRGSRGWKRRHCQVWLEESHAPYFIYHPPWRGLESKEDEEAPMDFNLEALPGLGLEVNCFLQGPAESLREEDGCPPQIPQWRSWREPRCMTHLAGGRNWLRFLGWMTMRNWHGRCRPLLNSHSRSANGTALKITIRPHWHHHAFVGRVPCHCLTPNSPGKTSGYCSRRRWWPMPKASSFGWKKLICLLRANHAFWQGT